MHIVQWNDAFTSSMLNFIVFDPMDLILLTAQAQAQALPFGTLISVLRMYFRGFREVLYF
ncbi:hypothetical protein ASG85_31345 [Paenibacillus sp. Soil724D2]|nr:hypothetical protein ASG85_31345 [Paenibacillus sp. Soil724D2]